MKENMVDFIDNMSGHDINTLEKIISLQYRKFIQFYWLMKQYAKNIKSMEYTFIDASSLDVDLTMSSKTVDKIQIDLTKNMDENNYDGEVVVSGKKIHISIRLDESMVP